MALPFLYVAFVRLLQLLRLRGRERDELAIEVVMLRHEVAARSTRSGRPDRGALELGSVANETSGPNGFRCQIELDAWKYPQVPESACVCAPSRRCQTRLSR